MNPNPWALLGWWRSGKAHRAGRALIKHLGLEERLDPLTVAVTFYYGSWADDH